MSADKYPCIFSRQMAAIVYLVYLTIIPRARVGYEMVNSQRGPYGRVDYNQSHIQQARIE